ncbi:MAG: GntR family transcriptional regulator [Spirochaetota bacterium]
MSSEDINKPLYVQIQEYIAELILSGKLAPETKINSEREFSDDLGVSRMTVHRAITELVNEGLLERRHGSGTYVAKPKITYEAREMVSYTKAIESRKITTASQLLELGEVPASRRLAEQLEVEIGHPLYRVLILRFANRVPVVLERDYFSCLRCPDLQEWDLEKNNIPDLLKTAYGARFSRIVQMFEAVTANETVAKQLRVEEGFPLIMLTRLIYNAEDNKPLVFSMDFLRSDYARIQSEITL